MTGLSRRARAAASLGMLACFLTPAASRAIPPGPPEISFHAERIDFSLTYDLTVQARDPDGVIRSISLCVDGACSTAERPADVAAEALACVGGDSGSLSLRHTFSAAGTFDAVVEVTGGGCPVLGAEEPVARTFEVLVPAPPPPHEPIECAHPGEPTATDVGVHPDRVVLGAVVTQTGPRASFKSGNALGFRAAARAINEMGGVCDRVVEVRLIDDGDEEQRREQFLRSMIRSDEFFALVSMSAHGFIEDLEEAGMPDVGTFGGSADEFASPLVWPVGPGNHAFGWIAVEEAYELGARTFGIVYDNTQLFGAETYEAVQEAVAARDDATLSASAGILPSRASYSAEIESFNGACEAGCDAVILALEPYTALTWQAGRPRQGTLRTSLHPFLFNDGYAANCGSPCAGQLAWTGFQHPFGNAPGAERACADMRAISPTADCADPFALAAYEAVFLAARAMGHAGVDLTRIGLGSALDAHPFDIGLHGGALSWASSRQANRWMRGYDIVIAQGSFVGWRDVTGWREDPR